MTQLPLVLVPEEAAQLLRCEPGTIEELCRRGELPGHKFGIGWVLPTDALIQRVNEISIEGAEYRREQQQPRAIVLRSLGKKPPALPTLQ